MLRKNKLFINNLVIITKNGQILLKEVFNIKSIKKFYRFITELI